MTHCKLPGFIIFALLFLMSACSSYQPVKNVWKTTKGLWNSYVSTPASVDYEDKGSLSPQAIALANSTKGLDHELTRLERAMQNADKPPTQEWLDNLFATFPWLSGFAGIKYDGTILGQQPGESMKNLDFNPLLYEDKKQSNRALRADIQPSPLGPEIMLATPLFDGTDFLGIVVAYFDMRSLMRYSSNPDDMIILSPGALLWPGKYDFAATPLPGVDWAKVVTESTAGTCSNATGSFAYIVRYFANLPLVFAVPEKGTFPESNGGLEQAAAFFPQEREKMPPPPLPERKPRRDNISDFAMQEEEKEAVEAAAPAPEETTQARTGSGGRAPGEIEPGSRESVLLKGGKGGRGREIEERQLEGENVPVERVQRPRRPRPVPVIVKPAPEPEPEAPMEVRKPSPFGPQEEQTPPAREETFVKPSPFGPPAGTEEKKTEPVAPAAETGSATETSAAPAETAPAPEKTAEPARAPARMRDGRPSPFGPPPETE